MSAFIVADKAINNIVNWLERELEEVYGTTIIRQKFMEQDFDTGKLGWTERLSHAMFQMNVIAVDVRYGSGEARKSRPLNYHYEVTEPVPMVQVLKSLQCWLYQCSEGTIPGTGLYKLFDTDVQMYLMSKIIDTLPEYQRAKWG
jgi:hypothetical protein